VIATEFLRTKVSGDRGKEDRSRAAASACNPKEKLDDPNDRKIRLHKTSRGREKKKRARMRVEEGQGRGTKCKGQGKNYKLERGVRGWTKPYRGRVSGSDLYGERNKWGGGKEAQKMGD